LTDPAPSPNIGAVQRSGSGILVFVLVAAMSLSCSGGGSQSSRDAATGGTGGPTGDGSGGSVGTGGSPTDAGAVATGTDGSTSTIPFSGGVYMAATSYGSSCSGLSLERFWPTRATVYYCGFDQLGYWFQFRPTDDQLFYQDDGTGLLMDVAGWTDTLVPSPPCGNTIARVIAFDGQGRLYYQCSNQVFRGNGELVADNVQLLAGVLGDGRVIVTRLTQTSSLRFEVVGPGGTNLSALDAEGMLGGIASAFPTATTTVGNDGFVMVQKLNDPAPPEVVVYHLDAQSRFSLVRRFVVADIATWTLVISDGTVFMREQAAPDTSDIHIIAYPPTSNWPVEIWREGDSPVLHSLGGTSQMLLGPLDAKGPSVVSE
jgi:hypothetical protein